MPAPKRQRPLYQRGDFRLIQRPGRTNLEIVYYDPAAKRERSISTGTGDLGRAKDELDKRYLAGAAVHICPTCRRPWDQERDAAPLLTVAIADYLTVNAHKVGAKAQKNRLAHVVRYVAETDAAITCPEITAAWVDGFRQWLLAQPVVSPKGAYMRARSLSHVEGCVLQLRAVINSIPGQTAQFKAEQMAHVSASPAYRADVSTLAAMFNFCLHPTTGRTPKENEAIAATRVNLLRYLQMAVATWARPDAVMEVRRDQWFPSARVLDMNPRGRRQTKKYRPVVPIARQFVPLLNEMEDHWLTVTTIRAAWDKMAVALNLPRDRESGPKLIRRSMATIARKRIGEANWAQGQMMLGHIKASTSDIYALPDPANLGLALSATESIIEDILREAPGAYRVSTARASPAQPQPPSG
jgi:hypothetical protein